MKTPKEYSNLINQNKITEKILGEVIYSINKRAKNWRDKKRKYRNYFFDEYDSYDNALENEKKYYNMKSDMLDRLEPCKIHKEPRARKVRKKIYIDDIDCTDLGDDIVISESERIDRITGEVLKYKYVYHTIDSSLYYLYYEIGEYSFHQPIEKSNLGKFEDLEIEIIENLVTYGKDVSELLSTQFCKKVYNKFINGNLKLI